MAKVDGSINDPTPTSAMAFRVDAYRTAVKLINDAGFFVDAGPEDALYLAQFLAGGE
jgi:hypothetical protein